MLNVIMPHVMVPVYLCQFLAERATQMVLLGGWLYVSVSRFLSLHCKKGLNKA
jgi:hypothetical protein